MKARTHSRAALGAPRTAKALRITSTGWEIGECTRVARMRSISVDGQGHYNPDRSEDLWGKAVRP